MGYRRQYVMLERKHPSVNLTWLMRQPVVYIWCCATHIQHSGPRQVLKNFKVLLKSLLRTSTLRLSINVIGDAQDRTSIINVIFRVEDDVGLVFYEIQFYDSAVVLPKLKNISEIMMPYFSTPDTDLKFRDNIAGLYEQFSEFGRETLFAIGRELSPGYFVFLKKWATNTFFNSTYIAPTARRYAGLNMGVMLLDLERIRKSEEYRIYLGIEYVDGITKQYEFPQSTLGGQDFLTLLELKKPQLFHILPCVWNRQLSLVWMEPSMGAVDMFDFFFRCDGRIHVYHGNSGTPIPDD